MKLFKVKGGDAIGIFNCPRTAAVAYFGTQAVIMFGQGQWLNVATGQIIEIE